MKLIDQAHKNISILRKQFISLKEEKYKEYYNKKVHIFMHVYIGCDEN